MSDVIGYWSVFTILLLPLVLLILGILESFLNSEIKHITSGKVDRKSKIFSFFRENSDCPEKILPVIVVCAASIVTVFFSILDVATGSTVSQSFIGQASETFAGWGMFGAVILAVLYLYSKVRKFIRNIYTKLDEL